MKLGGREVLTPENVGELDWTIGIREGAVALSRANQTLDPRCDEAVIRFLGLDGTHFIFEVGPSQDLDWPYPRPSSFIPKY